MQADFLTGVSLLKREDESLYQYWLSFSPMAPFFGVQWRFAPTLKLDFAAPAPAPAAKARPAEASRAAVKALELVAAEVAAPAKAPKPAAAPKAVEAEAAVEAAPAPLRAAPAGLLAEAPAVVDDLKRIKGVGPKLEAELNALGVWTLAQVAAFSTDDLVWIDEHLTSFKGRPLRDDWAGQAKALLAE